MSLTLRLVLMAVIAALPAVGLQFWNEHDLRRARTQELQEQVLRLARQQSAEIDRLAEGARQFLVALAQIPQINGTDTAGCADLLIRIRANYRAYRAIIVADADGKVVCSSIGPGPGIADRAYFRLAVQSNDFAVGNYVEGRGTNAPGIHFAYPLHDQQGKITGVVAAALDLDWFAARLRDKLPQNAALTVVDRIGTIVVRVPENDVVQRGQAVPDEFRPRLYAAEPGVVLTRGLDGNMRIVGYMPIAASENGMYVSVSRDWDAAFADLNRSVRRAALIITAGFAFSLLLAWAWSEYGIRRPINELLGAVESWRGGRYARVGRERRRSELGRLARAFDELAQSLSARERELVESEERLKDRERYLSFVLDRVPAGIMQTSPQGAYLFVNSAFCRLVGRSREDLMARPFSEITHPDDAVADRARFAKAIETRQDYTHRKRYLRPDGSTVWAENTVSHLDDPEQGVIAVSVELTERLRAENQQQRLVNELNHRVKNTLASVQALMVLTNRYSQSKEGFIRAFSARLHALATAHDLVTEGGWESVSLDGLARSELAPYAGGDMLRISGPPLKLKPAVAIGLGMIFHELATNAAKYGALSSQSGSVAVSWAVDGTTAPVLDILWREQGGPPASAPANKGFGSHLIEQTVADWRGSFKPSFEAEGFACTISLPWT